MVCVCGGGGGGRRGGGGEEKGGGGEEWVRPEGNNGVAGGSGW